MFDFKEVFTASMILFAVIDIIGATPIVISLKEKVGKIESEKATIVAMLIMIGFLFFRRGNIKLNRYRHKFFC